MEKEIKVEIIARETIKPSSPTPHHVRNYKLSLRDQYCTLHYTPVAFYYSTPTIIGGCESEEMVGLISERLKVSLSETLTRFYPLAGRLRDNLLVDCNDDGVDFVEARVINFHLSNFLDRPKLKVIDHLALPEPTDYYKTPLLLVQVNFFPCNGVVVTVKMSHKIADGFSIGIFMKGWSDIALGSPDAIVPDFNAASSRFPPRDDIPVISLTFKNITQKVVKKRFVIDALKIASLKAKTESESLQKPTRVEVITALVWKCAVAASRSRFGGSQRPYALVGGVNMRSRLVPPMPKGKSRYGCYGTITTATAAATADTPVNLNHTAKAAVTGGDNCQNRYVTALRNGCGRFLEPWLWAMLDNDDHDYESPATNLANLVCQLRKGSQESNDDTKTKEIASLRQVKGDDMEMYAHSSWCRFPIYETDFGWGKPTWVSPADEGGPVGIALLDARDGEGVEIWVNLFEEDMALFEADQELLAYASPNPSALLNN
ncbi:BAHD acyltransferase BIA1-like [Camellia sinensis]|uniref:BAHD acyltransferase BIA1-like n=1 Tax=Camellia sinensis TaxID=4442 RepID=UPI001035DD3C|nr:BAHD acyltransferase BIA1-like [Camellia sinensis]